MPLDKILHFIVGALLTTFISSFTALWFAVVMGSTAGLGKEIYDDSFPDTHSCDGMDFLATVLGSVFSGLTIAVLKIVIV